MKKEELIRRTREYLHDPEGKIWGDDEISHMLDCAAERYSKDTGIIRGIFSIFANEDGSCALPKGYISFLAAWNEKGYSIESISISELERIYGAYIHAKGSAEYAYEELNDVGVIRLCPNPRDESCIKTYELFYPYGIPIMPRYGIPKNTEGYGKPVRITKFRKMGEIVYIRTGQVEEIPDYIALIYAALSQAYKADSEFSDIGKAKLYEEQYRGRTARFGQISASNTGTRRRSKFY